METRPGITRKVLTSLAKRVRELRLARDWSMDDLCRESGLSKGSVNNIEAAKHDPRLSNLLALAKTFEVSLDSLIGLK